jgi:hypothetical protein
MCAPARRGGDSVANALRTQALGKAADLKPFGKAAAHGEAKSRSALDKLFDDVASRPASASHKEVVDKVDAADTGSAQAVTPYLAEIHWHYREAEVRYAAWEPTMRGADVLCS